MTPFIHDNFLLNSETARQLYHDIAKDLPIVDYHNHLNPQDLAQNRQFDNMAQLWVISDPYKHRAMRINGIPERLITGESTDKEKFYAWAETVPYTMGNPLFQWTALELKRVFDIDTLLCKESAGEIWNQCNEKLQYENFRAACLLKSFNTELVCTSDDLLDDFQAHLETTEKSNGFKVLPSLRGDSAVAFETPGFSGWLQTLQQQTGKNIESLDDYTGALFERLDILQQAGCLAADHALDDGCIIENGQKSTANQLFKRVLAHEPMGSAEQSVLKSFLLKTLGKEYSQRGWWMLLHIGAQRYTSTRLRNLAGPAGGFAGMGRACGIDDLCMFLDAMEKEKSLPRTILFNLNPIDNAAFATLTGSFAQDGVAGKIQFGPPWWYNDHRHGIEEQLNALSSYGLLSHFIGMTTDSRSILSFSRHEYFRRILCNQLGGWINAGEIPRDFPWLEEIVKKICYLNAKQAMS
ncbi:glucuronate isomerase [candidate division KSB1 bacterium]|nr:glucuronate isomerase [candidate division KSB1 bacterium]